MDIVMDKTISSTNGVEAPCSKRVLICHVLLFIQTKKLNLRKNQPKSVSLGTTYDFSSLRIKKKLVHGLPHLLNVQI